LVQAGIGAARLGPVAPAGILTRGEGYGAVQATKCLRAILINTVCPPLDPHNNSAHLPHRRGLVGEADVVDDNCLPRGSLSTARRLRPSIQRAEDRLVVPMRRDYWRMCGRWRLAR
jgi:hypothetical protein